MAAIARPKPYRLQDNLTAEHDRIFLTGTQALVRMLLSQRRRDRRQGLNTAGFVSGYRGSPLGGVDQAMWRAKSELDAHDVRFIPAINEDLAATMMMGSQQAAMHAERKVDGVFGMWYGKGPGVDRAGDALHHGNAAGATRHGGVLLVVGDDHTAASSSIPHASDATLASWSIPVIHPASVEDYEYFGLWGWALSRFSGAWVALKAVTETVESGRSFVPRSIPDFDMPPEAVLQHRREYSAREFLTPAIEERMQQRLEAVRLFSRHHPLDTLLEPAPGAKWGIISVGKASLDTSDALRRLCETQPELPAIRHLQIGLVWPLDTDVLARFALGLDHLIVIEEKGPVVEDQIRQHFFNAARRPSVYGKHDMNGAVLVPAAGQLSPSIVLHALASWLQQTAGIPLPHKQSSIAAAPSVAGITLRRPYFCSGCPHSTGTRVPDGSQALGGVGCHYMATWMDRNTSGLTQMGGEGVDWIGLAPFIENNHVFQNMGEGTYFHSGVLAIRQAIAAGSNITYKILFNDAVAMTGGQPVDGPISVPGLCGQLLGEGVRHIVVTTDEPERYKGVALPAGVKVHHRRELDAIQRELRMMKGVTVLVHDQTCAAEKRRRRKKKEMPEPSRRLFINTAVCEGCGDCGVQSNCLSIVPVETPLGRKRAIEQSTCNTDYTCVEGFCPSFVSVVGAKLRKSAAALPQAKRAELDALLSAIPEPEKRPGESCNLLVVGIGGTGVVTIGALVSMAAHLEGRPASVFDITGLAQKGGAVISHVRIGGAASHATPVRIDVAAADTAILCDGVAGMKPEAFQTLASGRTLAVLNAHLAPPAEFTRDPGAGHDLQAITSAYRQAVGDSQLSSLDAHELALRHFGDALLSNMILLGHAWQLGGVPVSASALQQAIELNGVAVSANLEAFRLGRLSAWRAEALRTLLMPAPVQDAAPETLEAILRRNADALAAYQNDAYARRYARAVSQVHEAELRVRPSQAPKLAMAAARSLYHLMAIKDEYEVARLYSDPEFRQKLAEQFDGDFSLRFHLAPPLFAPKDPRTGRPRKIDFGPYMEGVFRVLARGKMLRGTWLDVFGWQAERREEKRLLAEFEKMLDAIASRLTAENYGDALRLAELPLTVRGFGHVKAAAIARYESELAGLKPVFVEVRVRPRGLAQAHS